MQNEQDMDRTLGELHDIGYTSVQMSGQGKDIPDEAIRDLLEKHQLICPSTHGGFNDFEEDLPRMIRRHRMWKSDYPGIGGMPYEFRKSGDGFRAFAARANLVGKKLKDEGLTFIYHNHAFEFQKFDGVPGLQILMDNMPDVQFEIDVYWVQAGGAYPVDWLKKAAGRMDIVHYKEMVGCLRTDDHPSMTDMAPIGEGNMDWTRIMQTVDEIHAKYAFIEQDNAVKTDPVGCMRTSYQNLKKLGGRFA